MKHSSFAQRAHWLILPLILILAAALRFYQLGSLPPGLWFDEAWSAVAARDSAAQGLYPVYYAANFGGMHPAIVYLARLANGLTAAHPLALRYAVATVSTLTVGVSFFAFRAIFRLDEGEGGSERHPLILALLAALVLAIVYPFVHFSRMGFESSLPTLAGLLVFGSLAIAFRRRRAGWFSLTGGLLGLSLYSFDTARLFPFALTAVFWSIVLLHHRGEWRRYLGWYGLLAATAVFVFLPLGLYFLTHWDVFTARTGVATYNTLGPGADSAPLALLRNLGRTLGGLVLPGFGDVIARHNLPGRPVFDPFLAILFALGVGRLAWTWRRPPSLLLGGWAGVMLLAVILTDGAPTYTRIFGALPALAAIAALSAEWGMGRGRWAERAARYAIPLLLLLSLATTTRDYFSRWADLPQLFDDFQVGEWQAGQLALAKLAQGDLFLIPNQIDEAHPTLDLLLRETAVRSLPPGCLAYSVAGERPLTYLIHTPSAPDTLAALQAAFPGGAPGERIVSPLTGQTLYQSFTNRQPPIVNRQWSMGRFGAGIELAGEPGVEVGETAVAISLTWQAVARPEADHTLFFHLYPAGQEDSPPLAQLDVAPCLPTGQWRPGDAIAERYTLPLPPDLPPGDYTLALGWYTWPTFERLGLVGETAVLPNHRLSLQTITLE